MTTEEIAARLQQLTTEEQGIMQELSKLGRLTVEEAEDGSASRYELNEALTELDDERRQLESELIDRRRPVSKTIVTRPQFTVIFDQVSEDGYVSRSRLFYDSQEKADVKFKEMERKSCMPFVREYSHAADKFDVPRRIPNWPS